MSGVSDAAFGSLAESIFTALSDATAVVAVLIKHQNKSQTSLPINAEKIHCKTNQMLK